MLLLLLLLLYFRVISFLEKKKSINAGCRRITNADREMGVTQNIHRLRLATNRKTKLYRRERIMCAMYILYYMKTKINAFNAYFLGVLYFISVNIRSKEHIFKLNNNNRKVHFKRRNQSFIIHICFKHQ